VFIAVDLLVIAVNFLLITENKTRNNTADVSLIVFEITVKIIIVVVIIIVLIFLNCHHAILQRRCDR